MLSLKLFQQIQSFSKTRYGIIFDFLIQILLVLIIYQLLFFVCVFFGRLLKQTWLLTTKIGKSLSEEDSGYI